jgi:P-aminobenzoate N-oxygenase AurF
MFSARSIPVSDRRIGVVIGPDWPGAGSPKLRALYRRSQDDHWQPETDVDWPATIDFGRAVPVRSMLESQATMLEPFASHGSELWSQFRWELQSWLVCQSYHGEQAALSGAACLTAVLTDSDTRLAAAAQVADEARHVLAFQLYISRYLRRPYGLSPSLNQVLQQALADGDWSYSLLGMQVMVEGLADAVFRMGEHTFMDPVIRSVLRRVAADEARHVAFGTMLLKERCREDCQAEIRRREDFILTMAQSIGQRFLLEDLWERLGVDPRSGRRFAQESPLMLEFRRLAFSRVVSILRVIGLLTPAVVDGLCKLGLTKRDTGVHA